MKKKTFVIIWISIAAALLQLSFTKSAETEAGRTTAYFEEGARNFSSSAAELHTAIQAINNKDAITITRAKKALAACRIQFKKIAFFLSYFFPSESHVYNAAPVTEVEDAELEFIEPMGLQQIESLLFQAWPDSAQQQLLMQSESLSTSAADIHSLLYRFAATDEQVLESLRIELIRIIALYITGYDAPSLKTGIQEAKTALAAIRQVITFYAARSPKTGNKLTSQLQQAENYLAAHQNFDSFNRMDFLRQFGLPLQQNLGLFTRLLQPEKHTGAAGNRGVTNIFSRGNLLNNNDTAPVNLLLVQLGKRLFSENALSANNNRSCATCHQPGFYFTDRLPKSLALNGHGTLNRNAPTLLYAGLQQAQFWDGRATSLTELVKMVILNTAEMNGDERVMMQRLRADVTYTNGFRQVFDTSEKEALGLNEISAALAAYIATLNPRTSPFDKYMRGEAAAMSADAIKGFNLFMGKAKCATCHFAPLFNSSLPPYYDKAEYEIIGTTANQDLAHPARDTDRGRFNRYPVKYYDGSFKTPTVRNAAQTAPYMHNGAFASLDSVIAFYNKGGGNGLEKSNDMQTLSSEPLHLSQKESKQLVQFINALTDEPINIPSQKK